ncbi:hypothetical protein QN277_007866 [Acacia crassicarpa]|uniref:Uncharacterized protein n=1 Tax=Acacia crassicarpa TaxID=499986 RepID=A0AAE1IVC2_9FABA|nr:hypothetical protein QN277_007866 [Acacia crassicarpa]
MEKTCLWIPKEGLKKKDSLDDLCKDRELSTEDSSSFSDSQLKKLIKGANSRGAIVVNIVQSLISKDSSPFHGHSHYKIPKNMVSVDEKYLRCCLEFIHTNTIKGARSNITVLNSRSTNMRILPESSDPGQFIFECPMADGIGSVLISANPVRWSLSSAIRNKSMLNILGSPLFHQFGASDHKNENLSMMNYADAKGIKCYEYMDSPSGLSISSSHKLEKETQIMKGEKFGCVSSIHEGLASTSTTNSNSLSFASPTPSHGMLQCTWREGIPQIVFSADDKKEIYVANLKKVGPADNKALDYVYLIHLDKGDQKGREISDSNSLLVGKMNVSTSFTLDSNNDKIMETEFVLFGDNESYEKELYSSSHTQKRNKGLSRKLSQVFKSPLSKHTTLSKSDELESCPWDQHANNSLLETNVPPSFEMAAIVVKEHIPCTKPNEVGGWGLKFLNKSKLKQTPSLCESCTRNTGDCSTSMNILIPAGIHGGPSHKSGGPSSLIDRWRSGGHCDCGGWDEGCPLTVYQTRSTKAEVPSEADTQGESKNVDLVTQGSRDFTPTLRMVSVRDNLYFIHFRPPLSALQSFSIAAAMIHTQSPILRSNSAQRF